MSAVAEWSSRGRPPLPLLPHDLVHLGEAAEGPKPGNRFSTKFKSKFNTDHRVILRGHYSFSAQWVDWVALAP